MTKDELEHKYLVEDRSIIDIAKEYRCSGDAIWKRLKMYGIPRRSLSSLRKRIWIKHPELRERMAERVKSLWSNPEYRELMINKKKQLWANPEFKARMIDARRRYWKNISPEKKSEHIKAQRRSCCGLSPTMPEVYLEKLLNIASPNEWAYVGDGRVIFDGKNPELIS